MVIFTYTANWRNFTFLISHPNPPPLGEGVYEKRRLCQFAVYPFFDGVLDLVANLPCLGQLLLPGSCKLGWIIERPVQPFGNTRKNRAFVRRWLTNRDNGLIQFPLSKQIKHILRFLIADIDSRLSHHRNSQRIQF